MDIMGRCRSLRRLHGYTTPSELPDIVAYIVRRPIDVVTLITPWNSPLAIPTWKLALRLITKNTVVYKPASATSVSAVKLVEILGPVLSVFRSSGLQGTEGFDSFTETISVYIDHSTGA